MAIPTVRPMRPNDVQRIVELHDANCREVSGEGLEDPKAFEGLLRQYDEAEHAGCLVLVVDDEIMGYTAFATVDHAAFADPYGSIDELYIAPDCRRRGYGRLLADAASRQLTAHGAAWLSVHVAQEAEEGRAFWRGIGWDRWGLEVYRRRNPS